MTWWRGGDLLMPVMLAAALALYTQIGERLWALFGPQVPQEQMEITRGLTLIRVLAGVLPLLGLLGTVTGMVDTFAALGQQDDTVGLGGGVALALTATQYGLALAIPAVVADWLLRRRAALLLEKV